MANHVKKSTLYIVGSSPEPGAPMTTGYGCGVRPQRIEPKTRGTSMNANMPKSALRSARLPPSSTIVRRSTEETYSIHITKIHVSTPHHVHHIPQTTRD